MRGDVTTAVRGDTLGLRQGVVRADDGMGGEETD